MSIHISASPISRVIPSSQNDCCFLGKTMGMCVSGTQIVYVMGPPFPWVGWCQSFNTEIGVTGQALEVRNQLFSKLSQSFLSLWMGSTHDPVSWILHTSVSSRVNYDGCICVLCVYNFYVYIEYASNTMTKLYVQAHWLLVEEYLGKPVCMIVIIVWWIQVNTPQPSFHVFIVWLDLVERFGCKP